MARRTNIIRCTHSSNPAPCRQYDDRAYKAMSGSPAGDRQLPSACSARAATDVCRMDFIDAVVGASLPVCSARQYIALRVAFCSSQRAWIGSCTVGQAWKTPDTLSESTQPDYKRWLTKECNDKAIGRPRSLRPASLSALSHTPCPMRAVSWSGSRAMPQQNRRRIRRVWCERRLPPGAINTRTARPE